MFPAFNDFQKDADMTLRQLSLLGFEEIELYGDFVHPAQKIWEICRRNGLTISGAQISWHYLQSEKSLEKVMAYHQAVGNKHLIISALGGPWEAGHKCSENTIETWLAHVQRINEIQKVLEQNCFTLDYHTHDYDFGDKIEGKQSSYELLLENTNSQVGIEIDTGSCIKGGSKPEALISKLGKRARFVHCKPVTKEGSFEINIGADNDANAWQHIIEASRQAGVARLVVEPENERTDWQISMKIGYDYVKRQLQCDV
jgi:sugar phosphate isomerase/epimerase